MLPTLSIPLDGRINRRDARDRLKVGQVISRENFLVVGNGEIKVNKKVPGSDRVNSTAVGSLFTTGYNYYSNQLSKIFAFENETKKITAFDSNGNTSQALHLPSDQPPAYPCWEEMKISDGNILAVADGKNGIYTYDGNVANNFVKQTDVTLNPVDMIVYLDRLWVIEENSDALNFSVNLDFFDFTDSTDAGVILVGSKRGAKNMKLFVHNETLYIFKDDALFVLEGSTPSEFSVREVFGTLGLAARRGFARTNFGTFMFLGSDFEVWSCAGSQSSLKCLSYDLALAGDFTKDLSPIIDKNHMDQVCATFHNFLFRLSFAEYGANQSSSIPNNLEYIFNTVNETDALTRGNNVSCYIVRDKLPDTQQLITGRSDAGYLMRQYCGLNFDNQSSTQMSVKLQSGFARLKDTENFRFKHIWGDFQVLGATDIPINYFLDTRLAASTSKTVTLKTRGETKAITSFVTVQNQTSVTSRAVAHWAYSKGQSVSFELSFSGRDLDLSLSQFFIDIISKERKRNVQVGV